jgi:hypothetical protein
VGGFGATWVSNADDKRSVDYALSRLLEGKRELLRQLRSHASGKAVRTLH